MSPTHILVHTHTTHDTHPQPSHITSTSFSVVVDEDDVDSKWQTAQRWYTQTRARLNERVYSWRAGERASERAYEWTNALRDGIAFGAHECFALSIRRDFAIVYVIPPSQHVHVHRTHRTHAAGCSSAKRYIRCEFLRCITMRNSVSLLGSLKCAGRRSGQDYGIYSPVSTQCTCRGCRLDLCWKLKTTTRKMEVILWHRCRSARNLINIRYAQCIRTLRINYWNSFSVPFCLFTDHQETN